MKGWSYKKGRQEAQLESSLGKKLKLSIMLTDHVQGKERYTQGIEDFVRNFVVMHCKSFKVTHILND